jgi:hypothetical protein
MENEIFNNDTGVQKKSIPFQTDAVARKIVDAAFAVHKTLGPGLLENVYEIYGFP